MITLIHKYRYQLLTLAAHINLIAFIWYAGWFATIVALVIAWAASNLFHYLYMHRIYTHSHFVVSPHVHFIGLVGFSALNLGSPPVYAAVHMKHHTNSGKQTDPHNPYTLGFWRTLMSLWDDNFSPDRKFFKRYLDTPFSRLFHNIHIWIALVSAMLLPALIVVAFWMSKIVIVLVHIKQLGYQSKISEQSDNPDTSRNVWWLKPLTWGEELHNNHHYYAARANHNVEGSSREFDLLYYIGCLIGRKKDD